jgi:SAM-dependent methyltransferase
MPVMSSIEQVFCRSVPWRQFSSRVVVPWVLEGHELTGNVLELGSGSGAMAAELLGRFPSLHLVASDLDPAMLDAARLRLDGYGGRARVQRTDATSLSFADNHFDAVVSFLMLHHVIDWEQALSEAVRVLRPGGVLLGYDLVDSVPARIIHDLDRSPHRLTTADAIDAQLRSLDVEDVNVTTAFAGTVTRFAATKSGGPGVSDRSTPHVRSRSQP